MIPFMQYIRKTMEFKKHICFAGVCMVWASTTAMGAADFPCDSTRSVSAEERKKWGQQGNWAGFGVGTGIFMHQADGQTWDPWRVLANDVVYEAPEAWELTTSNVATNWRLEANPIEYRQRVLGNLVGITTGVGVDWWRVGIDNAYRWNPDTSGIDVQTLGGGEVLRNRLNMGWVRIPVLASVRTAREADKGLHIEAGAVAGYRVFGVLARETKTGGAVVRETSHDLAINTFQLNARVLFGLRKVSVFVEAPLLPLFTDSPDRYAAAGTLGLHVAMH